MGRKWLVVIIVEYKSRRKLSLVTEFVKRLPVNFIFKLEAKNYSLADLQRQTESKQVVCVAAQHDGGFGPLPVASQSQTIFGVPHLLTEGAKVCSMLEVCYNLRLILTVFLKQQDPFVHRQSKIDVDYCVSNTICSILVTERTQGAQLRLNSKLAKIKSVIRTLSRRDIRAVRQYRPVELSRQPAYAAGQHYQLQYLQELLSECNSVHLPSQLPTQQELLQLKFYYTNLKSQLRDLEDEAYRSTYKFLLFKAALFK